MSGGLHNDGPMWRKMPYPWSRLVGGSWGRPATFTVSISTQSQSLWVDTIYEIFMKQWSVSVFGIHYWSMSMSQWLNDVNDVNHLLVTVLTTMTTTAFNGPIMANDSMTDSMTRSLDPISPVLLFWISVLVVHERVEFAIGISEWSPSLLALVLVLVHFPSARGWAKGGSWRSWRSWSWLNHDHENGTD